MTLMLAFLLLKLPFGYKLTVYVVNVVLWSQDLKSNNKFLGISTSFENCTPPTKRLQFNEKNSVHFLYVKFTTVSNDLKPLY